MAIILRPKHITGLWLQGGAFVPMEGRTRELLAKLQAAHLAKNPAASGPQAMPDAKQAYVGNGAWRIRCRCGEATHADPEWRAAHCFGCGAIWRVEFPDDWADIEDLLAKRPVQGTRNWRAPETLDDLLREQIEHGDPT